MSVHIDTNDPRYRQSAAEILRRHDKGEPEANITSAVRNFLTLTGLVKDEEIVEENPPAEGSRRAVDLAALDTFIEFKRRIGTAGGFNPDPKNVQQLGSDIRHLAETNPADLLHGRDFRNKTGLQGAPTTQPSYQRHSPSPQPLTGHPLQPSFRCGAWNRTQTSSSPTPPSVIPDPDPEPRGPRLPPNRRPCATLRPPNLSFRAQPRNPSRSYIIPIIPNRPTL